MRTAPTAALQADLLALKLQLANAEAAYDKLNDQLAARDQTIATQHGQLQRLAKELVALRRVLEAQKSSVKEKLQVEYLAREQRVALADDRIKLQNIRHQLAEVRNRPGRRGSWARPRMEADAPRKPDPPREESPAGQGEVAAQGPRQTPNHLQRMPTDSSSQSNSVHAVRRVTTEAWLEATAYPVPAPADRQPSSNTAAPPPSGDLSEWSQEQLRQEYARLEAEYDRLMGTGAYEESDAVIRRLDERMSDILVMLRSRGEYQD